MQTATRTEKDTMGRVDVPADALWGAQTERARRNFRIGSHRMPAEVIRALAVIKKAAAVVNAEAGDLDERRGAAILEAAEDVAAGRLDEHFPLSVWQSGSGTQTNMNVNEVIANRACQILGRPLGSKDTVHPNDHVNMAQSTNDTFSTAMHVAAAREVQTRLLPALDRLRASLREQGARHAHLPKIGRTHMMDAVPVTLGQEFEAWAAMVEAGMDRVRESLERLLAIPQGGTAVGTGLNTPGGWSARIAAEIAYLTGLPFEPAGNLMRGIASHDDLVDCSASLGNLAASLVKIASDIRLLASGPDCGIGEIRLPAGEPGSSIMPGKVNPTQVEALVMVCHRVMGNHVSVTVAGSSGVLELNVSKPLIAHAVLESLRLLSDAVTSFAVNCVDGIEPDEERMRELLSRSLMLVTALTREIGYDAAASIAAAARGKGTSLKDETLRSGLMDGERFDRLVDPLSMALTDVEADR